MKELKCVVGFNADGKVVSIDPKNKADGPVVDYAPMEARLLSQSEIDREASECMQQDCHTYTRVHNRVKQKR